MRAFVSFFSGAKGREVVFQCRDEGPLRARVKWTRDGAPLPPGSVDYNGRLEIPNIRRGQAGVYVCEAPDHPSSTPGQRVTVELIVEACEYLEMTGKSSQLVFDI